MRGFSLGAALCALLLAAGCDRIAVVKADPTPVAGEDAAPVQRAPTKKEQDAACPMPAPSQDELRALAAKGDFAALDARVAQARDAYAQSPHCEPRVSELIELYASFDLDVLDAWIEARPESSTALSARATKWVWVGWERKNGGAPPESIREPLAHAEPDVERALELDPAAMMAVYNAMNIARISGDSRGVRKRLVALIEHDPLTYIARRHAQLALSPTEGAPGGSVEAVRDVADEAESYLDRNPRLRLLRGFVEEESAHLLMWQGRYAEAATLYRQALRRGHQNPWYDGYAQALGQLGEWKTILDITDPWIATLGDQYAQSHAWRGFALSRLGRAQEAIPAYTRAIEMFPNYHWALGGRGHAYRTLGMLSEAAGDFQSALALGDDAWTLQQLTDIASADPYSVVKSADLMRARVDHNPSDRDAWFVLGSALHASRSPDARAALERYVALAQSDAQQQTRVIQARRMLEPAAPRAAGLPGQAHLGLKPKS